MKLEPQGEEGLPSRLDRARAALKAADFLLIGGGAGLSDAAGLRYSGKRFSDSFKPFIEKYGIEDMYTAGFYPFRTEEERWGYWAKHIAVNRYDPPAAPLYRELLRLAEGKRFFVITTNVDHQFEKAGFPEEKIFAVQGDYGLLQCAKGCHETLYPNEDLVRDMVRQTESCRVPARLVPRCPVCGGGMEVHIRKDGFFVEDDAWRRALERYQAYLQDAQKGRLVLMELGVGFNTPGIIRFPFEQLAYQRRQSTLLRFNSRHPSGAEENRDKTIAFCEDMARVMGLLTEKSGEAAAPDRL